MILAPTQAASILRVASVLVCLAAEVAFGAEPSCKIVDYGLVSTEKQSGTRPYAGAIGGEAIVFDDFKIYKTTTVVPVRQGIRFGVRRLIENIPSGENVRIVVRHPRMKGPLGDIDSQVFEEQNPAGLRDSYGLDEPYEQVAGQWRFEYWYAGKMLCAHEFSTVKTP
jgi:hypothetical protein